MTGFTPNPPDPLEEMTRERDRYRQALERIESWPRQMDGEGQVATMMQVVAAYALNA